jgi:two-component system, chemotaxis family, response regulator WspR
MQSEVKQPIFRKPVVLLVDDQALVAHRVKDLLKNESDITFHYCGTAATAIAQALSIKPTVILLDLIMPGMDGLTLCRCIRDNQDLADLPVIMLSANDDGETKAHSFASGANDYLVKLPEAVELIARIRYHSKSYINHLERDEAYEALCESQIELEKINARLRQIAHRDDLTQLPNRPLLIDRFAMILAKAKRDNQLVAVLYLDLDDFKPINDLYGHKSGDETLRLTAHRLLSCVRETDTVARLGGDEFAIILGELDNFDYAGVVAEKIIHTISLPITLTDQVNVQLGISIGISLYPQDGQEIDRLLACADHAMYESKRCGKNRFCFFSDTEPPDSQEPWLEFKSIYLSGIREFDQQHQFMVQLINQLHSKVMQNADFDEIIQFFDDLIIATEHHFYSELAILKQYNYPEIEKHDEDHHRLLAELQELKNRFHEEGGAWLILDYLKSWLLDHMLYGDEKANRFLIEQGAH